MALLIRAKRRQQTRINLSGSQPQARITDSEVRTTTLNPNQLLFKGRTRIVK